MNLLIKVERANSDVFIIYNYCSDIRNKEEYAWGMLLFVIYKPNVVHVICSFTGFKFHYCIQLTC